MNQPLLSRLWTAIRGSDWWAFKIPPLLAVAYAGFIRFTPPADAWVMVAAALGAILMVAAYGYLLNDVCDIDADRASRRPNRMAAVGAGGRAAGLILPAAGALALGLVTGDPVMLALVVLNLLLPTLYSVPPIRLKGRGAWGALADASGVHALPAALVARAVTLHAAEPPWVAVLFVTSAVGWALFAGLRGIIVHQVADRRADLLADVSTFAGALGVARSRRLVMRRLLPVELLSLGTFLALILPHAPAAAALLAVFVVLEVVKVRQGWTLPLFEPDRQPPESYRPILNNELYEMWLPFAFGLQLALAHPLLWFLLVLQAFLFWPMLRVRFGGVLFILGVRRGTAEAGKPAGAMAPARATPAFQVVLGATNWTVNGVNIFSTNLARGLSAVGVPAHVLLTEDNTNLVATTERLMPFPAEVSFQSLPVIPADGWGKHWGSMVRHLEESAPCVYIPNYDWRHSCVCPQLSDDVVVVGVVHSDDPLHYEHVRRLGRYWNAIVAVSRALAERTAQECPELADRIVTIPNGVRLPAAQPVRPDRHGPLRLIYHGILKQHQKRVLDLPRIVQAAADIGVEVELSIVGAGPDEADLKAAAAGLVDRGLIRFLGVVSPDDMASALEAHDVYLLTSEFEGMPNALIEAMGRGCVPVVTDTTSGVPELIRDGRSGFLVPVGDTVAFAECLRVLQTNPGRRRRMAKRAFRAAATDRFRVERMVEAYREVFDQAWRDVRSGQFVRPRGPLLPPPREVAGIPLFPVELPYVEAGLGAFASVDDAQDYRDQVRSITARGGTGVSADRDPLERAASRVSLAGVRVFVSAPVWTYGGVNLWSADLVRGLRAAGLDARLLLTEEDTELVSVDEPRMLRPSNLPVHELAVDGVDNWGLRWGTLVRTLETAAPCIYFPSYDWRHSGIVPALSDRVIVVGTMHDTGALYTEHAARLGPYWNAVVATSRQIAAHVRSRLPALAGRLNVIQGGSTVPAELERKAFAAGGSVHVLCVGELDDTDRHTASVWAQALADETAGLQVVVVDPSPSLRDVPKSASARVVIHPNRQEWLALCRASHFVVADHFQGDAEDRLVEAMGHGCIPVWVGTETPDARLIRDGETGVVVPPGQWDLAVGRIAALAGDPDATQRMAVQAHDAARRAVYRTDQMIERYLELFKRLVAQVETGGFRRSRGPVLPPPAFVDGISVLPVGLTCRTALGPFPTPEAAGDYERQVEQVGVVVPKDPDDSSAPASWISLDGVRVFVSAPIWTSTSVNLWSEDLVRGLRHAGLDARLLLTEEATGLIQIEEPRLERPSDLPIDEIRVDGLDNWGARWGALVRMLEANAPCIYLPSFDWRHSCVVPALSNRVTVVGTLHDTGSLYTEHAVRLGEYWNGVVGTSDAIAGHVRQVLPQLEPRLATIPHGLNVPVNPVSKPPIANGVASVLIVGSGEETPGHSACTEAICQALAQDRGSFDIVVVNPSPSNIESLAATGARVVVRPNQEKWLELCRTSHFVIARDLRDESRRRVVEAMGHGCIPVWAASAPMDDLLVSGNGLLVPSDGWSAVAAEIRALIAEPERQLRMAASAHRTAKRAGFRVSQMVDAYLALFRRLLGESTSGRFTRARGPILPPPAWVDGQSILPIDYACETPFGRFPTVTDAECFDRESGLAEARAERDDA